MLESPDFYSRLYSLQLLLAISSARPERTQECVLTAPLGTPRLVAILDDPRDPVRVAGLELLNDLSHSSAELQKLFVFENAFERLFTVIEGDGGLKQGGPIVQDCLSLLANLLRFNTSNQTAFRETGGFSKCAGLLPGAKKQKKQRTSVEEEDDDWASPQNERNTWGLLAILRMLLARGSATTKANQTAFAKHGLLHQILEMAFSTESTTRIKVEALNTCADMIRGNPQLQEGFAPLQVTPPMEPETNGTSSPRVAEKKYIIEALLDLALQPPANESFDLRFAAAECIKAYFSNHKQIRDHFLNRAIEGHLGEDETANILTTLMSGPHAHGSASGDAYRVWFAAVLVFHLIHDDREAKDRLMSVSEGDAEAGEEVVTCIQALTSVLITSLQMGEDDRIPIAYFMLLCGWLFEDAAAVNDFLGEASTFNSLIQHITKPSPNTENKPVVNGLCAALLGIIYEFSTKDSPVPRRKLQSILLQSLGREKYLDTIAQLKAHPHIRDFEPHDASFSTGPSPRVYFDEDFVDFLKDNFSRLARAIDRDPGQEQHESHDGIDRDVLDALRGEIAEKNNTIESMQTHIQELEQRASHASAEHRKVLESAQTQVNTIKRINEDLHANHEKESRKLEREHKQAMLELENRMNLQIAALNAKLKEAEKEKTIAVARTKQEGDERVDEMRRGRADVEERLSKAHASRQEALDSAKALEEKMRQVREELTTTQQEVNNVRAELLERDAKIEAMEKEKGDAQKASEHLKKEIEGLKKEVQDLKSKNQDASWKAKDAEDKQKKAENRTKDLESQVKKAEEKAKKAEEKAKKAGEKVKKAEKEANEKEEARQAVQTELDDLFIILGDLEEKRNKDKVCVMCDRARGSMDLLTTYRNGSKNLARRCRMMKMTTMRKTMRTMKTRTTMRRNRLYCCLAKSGMQDIIPIISRLTSPPH